MDKPRSGNRRLLAPAHAPYTCMSVRTPWLYCAYWHSLLQLRRDYLIVADFYAWRR
jgi:hypothetical protein